LLINLQQLQRQFYRNQQNTTDN